MSETAERLTEIRWNERARYMLVGSTITAASYMSQAEADAAGFSHRPLVLELDNGRLLFPMADDEGNDGGALVADDFTFPVLR